LPDITIAKVNHERFFAKIRPQRYSCTAGKAIYFG
jgi:hypothetical protein